MKSDGPWYLKWLQLSEVSLKKVVLKATIRLRDTKQFISCAHISRACGHGNTSYAEITDQRINSRNYIWNVYEVLMKTYSKVMILVTIVVATLVLQPVHFDKYCTRSKRYNQVTHRLSRDIDDIGQNHTTISTILQYISSSVNAI